LPRGASPPSMDGSNRMRAGLDEENRDAIRSQHRQEHMRDPGHNRIGLNEGMCLFDGIDEGDAVRMGLTQADMRKMVRPHSPKKRGAVRFHRRAGIEFRETQIQ